MPPPRTSCLFDGCPPKRHRRGGIAAVHSGQFMRSDGHNGTTRDEDNARPRYHDDSWGCVVDSSYHNLWLAFFGANDLDALVERISATYCVRFSSPRWNDFQGISLRWRDKVRMNNLLWREWHVQFNSKRASSFCRFTCPLGDLDDPIHRKPLAVVLEGKYWKKKLDAVAGEYKRRRVYWRVRQCWKRAHSDGFQTASLDGKVSETCSMESRTVGSEHALYCDTDNAFLDSFMQSAWMPNQRRAPDEQHDRVRPGVASEQDVFVATLIDDFLRNGEMDWLRDHASHDPPMSVKDAIGMMAEAAALKRETPDPSISTRRSATATLPRRSRSRSRSQRAPSEPPSGTPETDFYVLRRVVPSLTGSNCRKLTKQKMLESTLDHCKGMREDNRQLDEEISALRQQMLSLRREAAAAEKQVPSIETLRQNLCRDMFDTWVPARSSDSPKFPVFALLMAPLYASFMSSVSSSSSSSCEGQLESTVVDWLDQHCSLPTVRQSAVATLSVLSKSPSMAANPDKLPQELLSKPISSWLADAQPPSHS